MGKDTPSRIGHFAYKFCHCFSVYLIPSHTGMSPLERMFFGFNSRAAASERRNALLFGLFHDGNSRRSLKSKKGFRQRKVLLPIPEPVLQLDSSRLEDANVR